MKRLRRIAITVSCLAAVSFFIACNTWLASPPHVQPFVPVFIVPFTHHKKSLELPPWMWVYPLFMSIIFTFAAIGCWIALFVRRRSKVRVESREWM